MVRAKKEKGFKRRSYYYHIGDGFHFYINRLFPNGSISLRCVRHYLLKCRGRAIMNMNRTGFRHRGQHNHPADRHHVSVRKLHECILRRCRGNDNSALNVIVQEEGINFRRRVRMKKLPNSVRSSARRAFMSDHPPIIPNNLSYLAAVLRDPAYRHLCTSADGEDFLYAGSCGKAENSSRCVIFVSRRLMRLLSTVTKVHSDGTWKARPKKPNTSQLFCIVTTIDHKAVPLVMVLMESRLQRTYEILFAKLKLICPNFTPIHIVCDFELGQMNAWSVVFANPDLIVQGCYFHYAEDVCLYGKTIGLSNLILNNDTVETLVRCCCAIPLLPTELLDTGLAILVVVSVEKGCFDELALFFNYILTEWLQKKREVLSVYGCEDRTNNCCESFNSLFISIVGKQRPNIWRFLKCLRIMEDITYQDLYNMCHGERVRRLRKASAIANDENIRNLSDRLQDGLIDVYTFLRHSSRRIQNVFDDVFPPAP